MSNDNLVACVYHHKLLLQNSFSSHVITVKVWLSIATGKRAVLMDPLFFWQNGDLQTAILMWAVKKRKLYLQNTANKRYMSTVFTTPFVFCELIYHWLPLGGVNCHELYSKTYHYSEPTANAVPGKQTVIVKPFAMETVSLNSGALGQYMLWLLTP
jgi:hypothetical protein